MVGKAATYLTNLPPSMGWFLGGNWHRVYHLVTHQEGFEFVTLCKRRLHHPLTSQYWSGARTKAPLCKNCRKAIDKWRSANAAEPQSNTAPP